eukprot:TRINITY_DN1275_c0_g1_i1.p1 TRINITY_DN1275_c0_g1~~TRINITY_DN1275_c0_g1_i1.p1  ORF type:complete len:543 (+),score=120.60 TRINITY_DN1275_c0_g1_i1:90-1718(+)
MRITTAVTALAVAVSACCVAVAHAAPRQASVYLAAEGKFTYKEGVLDKDAVAMAEYDDSIPTTGWGRLVVTSNDRFDDSSQAYAAGLAEGGLTQQRTWEWVQNMVVGFSGWNTTADIPKPIQDYLQGNRQWAQQQAASNQSSALWQQVLLVERQWQGLYDGYALTAPADQQLTELQLRVATSFPDVFSDLVPALVPSLRPDFKRMTPEQFSYWVASHGHCSSLIKVAGDLSELYFGHVTWMTFQMMTRIFKTYNLNYKSALAKVIHFSSYPGSLTSTDDFHVTDSGLAVIETSLAVYNMSIYRHVSRDGTGQLLYWVRLLAATRLAATPAEWAPLFASYNSGSYNNQWMILNVKAFKPHEPLPDGLLVVLEQMPGKVRWTDATPVLQYGYWPSYNVPYFADMYDYAGFPEAVKMQGPDMLSYELAVRAQIFRRDQGKVVDVPSFQQLMSYNDYQHDPISKHNPVFAISARADLSATSPGCFGGLDLKVSTASLWRDQLTVLARSGPTAVQQPPLDLNTTRAKCTNTRGMPRVWNFGFQTFRA